jgi:hypothetical protein
LTHPHSRTAAMGTKEKDKKKKAKAKTKTKRVADEADVAASARHRGEREVKAQEAAQLHQLKEAARPSRKIKEENASAGSSAGSDSEGASSSSTSAPKKKKGKAKGNAKGKDKKKRVSFPPVRWSGVGKALGSVARPYGERL